MGHLLREALDIIEAGRDAALITVVESSGSTPAKVGAKMLVTKEAIQGTVGGGALEKQLIENTRLLLNRHFDAYLENIDVVDTGMQCGGTVTVFIEPLRGSRNLWIFGGGHIAAALVPLVHSLDFRVTVVDNRKEFATEERFGGKAETKVGEYKALLTQVPKGCYAVIVTHGHEHDKEVLKGLAQIEPKLPYIGMIGSRHKVGVIIDELTADGIELGRNLYSPIGLELGGNSPAQIAISIASEILAVSQGKSGLPHCRSRLSR